MPRRAFSSRRLGLNTGLQSSHNLAWKLAAVVRGDASDVLLDSYEAERHTAALRTMENTNDNAFEVYEIIQTGLRGDEDQVRQLVSRSRRGGPGRPGSWRCVRVWCFYQ
jgi:2-polyprenyl-6-methoxyphenol hydroxylase-like FAD-dependent oxidoreductase